MFVLSGNVPECLYCLMMSLGVCIVWWCPWVFVLSGGVSLGVSVSVLSGDVPGCLYCLVMSLSVCIV